MPGKEKRDDHRQQRSGRHRARSAPQGVREGHLHSRGAVDQSRYRAGPARSRVPYGRLPLGPLLLAATEGGLVRVAFELEGFDAVLEMLATRISPRILAAPRRLDPTARELEEYFAGTRHSFDVPVDFALSSGFRQAVQRYLPHIRYAHTLTYREVAERVGNPKATRAVGSACATNPLPIVVPCHRVVRTDGGLGGYLGGTAAKQALLALERAGTTREDEA
ncbi:methylated-DNA--[protein]-cysteine S-methyltransferase [Raineyella fluvialis]|uniref:methylated-DNA--[protein]-cysteine S-methyltransferase n=1 Tax=Raineyella fluvialis TaxID=2662261 RepID=UPI001E2C11BD|nr:methylated-DNA--[protein]-cysteine S-methyltransferase [Raineyella fluvialis]